MNNNMLTLMTTLESRELEVGPDEFVAEESTELLALYLLRDDLCDARLLFKRISPIHKESPELLAVWEVGKKLWWKDLLGFYVAVRAFNWSERIAPIMAGLIESTQEKVVRLIGTAYTSVRPDDVAILLGVPVVQVEQIVAGRGWTVNDGLIIPQELLPEEVQLTASEDQIGKLTEFVSFLEN